MSVCLSLAILTYYPSLLAGPPNYIQYWHRADMSSLCLSANKDVSIDMSPIRERRFRVRSWFSSSTPHVLFVLFGLFVRWKMSGCTAVVLTVVDIRICSKQHITFLCSSHLAFTQSISLAFMCCTQSVELTQLQFGVN